jgi:hypothetical protein
MIYVQSDLRDGETLRQWRARVHPGRPRRRVWARVRRALRRVWGAA